LSRALSFIGTTTRSESRETRANNALVLRNRSVLDGAFTTGALEEGADTLCLSNVFFEIPYPEVLGRARIYPEVRLDLNAIPR